MAIFNDVWRDLKWGKHLTLEEMNDRCFKAARSPISVLKNLALK